MSCMCVCANSPAVVAAVEDDAVAVGEVAVVVVELVVVDEQPRSAS